MKAKVYAKDNEWRVHFVESDEVCAELSRIWSECEWESVSGYKGYCTDGVVWGTYLTYEKWYKKESDMLGVKYMKSLVVSDMHEWTDLEMNKYVRWRDGIESELMSWVALECCADFNKL